MKRTLVSVALLTVLLCVSPASAQPNPNQADMSIDTKMRADTIASLAKGLKEAYVFPDVGKKVAAMLQGTERPRKNSTRSRARKAFSDLLTRQMSDFTHDKHLRLVYSAQNLPPLPVSKPGAAPPPSPRMLLQLRISNYEFERVERLAGNIGYLKLNGFVDAERTLLEWGLHRRALRTGTRD